MVIVQDGRLVESNLRRERLTPADVSEEARLNQIGSLERVKWAVLEPNGHISFIERQAGKRRAPRRRPSGAR